MECRHSQTGLCLDSGPKRGRGADRHEGDSSAKSVAPPPSDPRQGTERLQINYFDPIGVNTSSMKHPPCLQSGEDNFTRTICWSRLKLATRIAWRLSESSETAGEIEAIAPRSMSDIAAGYSPG